jgi:hypothetical protein
MPSRLVTFTGHCPRCNQEIVILERRSSERGHGFSNYIFECSTCSENFRMPFCRATHDLNIVRGASVVSVTEQSPISNSSVRQTAYWMR